MSKGNNGGVKVRWVRFSPLPLKYKIMIELITIWLTLGILKVLVLVLKSI